MFCVATLSSAAKATLQCNVSVSVLRLLGSGHGYISLSDETHTLGHYLLFNWVNLILLSELCLLLDTMEDPHTRYSKRLVSNLKQAAARQLPQTLVSCCRAASR